MNSHARSVAESVWGAGLVASDVALYERHHKPALGARDAVTFVACPLARAILPWHQVDLCVRSEAGPAGGPALFHLLTTGTHATEGVIGALYPLRAGLRSACLAVVEEIRRFREASGGYHVVALVAGETESVMFDGADGSPPAEPADDAPLPKRRSRYERPEQPADFFALDTPGGDRAPIASAPAPLAPGERLAREEAHEAKQAADTIDHYVRLAGDPGADPGTRAEARAWLDWHRHRMLVRLAQAEVLRAQIVATLNERRGGRR